MCVFLPRIFIKYIHVYEHITVLRVSTVWCTVDPMKQDPASPTFAFVLGSQHQHQCLHDAAGQERTSIFATCLDGEVVFLLSLRIWVWVHSPDVWSLWPLELVSSTFANVGFQHHSAPCSPAITVFSLLIPLPACACARVRACQPTGPSLLPSSRLVCLFLGVSCL